MKDFQKRNKQTMQYLLMKKERKMIKDYAGDSQYPPGETADSFSSGPFR